MKIATVFRNLDPSEDKAGRELIEREVKQLEKRIKRFDPELVRLEAVVSRSAGKKRVRASLRLQLPSGVVATREEGFEVDDVLREAFKELGARLERHLARLRGDWTWKRPARRARAEAMELPSAETLEEERRALYFDLIEDHLDDVYNQVRRELTYMEANGDVPDRYFSVGTLVDATILKGLERFEERPDEFSVGDWLARIAYETIDEEARKARRAIPWDAASLERPPEKPAEDPTVSDQEMFEFYQPDEVLHLEDLVPQEGIEDPETATARHELAIAVHRAVAALPRLWRQALFALDVEDMTPERAAAVLGRTPQEVAEAAAQARAYLRQRLKEQGVIELDTADAEADAVSRAIIVSVERIPQPIEDRERVAAALRGA